MGVHKNIGLNRFPKQGTLLGTDVKVVFDYDTSKGIMGKVVRDDNEEPFITLFELSDGRYVKASECQYQPIYKKEQTT